MRPSGCWGWRWRRRPTLPRIRGVTLVQASRGNSAPSTLTVAKEGVGVLEEVEEQGRRHNLREE